MLHKEDQVKTIVRPIPKSMDTLPSQHKRTLVPIGTSGHIMETAVSGIAACASHILHHPLYTLKSQMMYYGHDFKMTSFLKRSFNNPSFLYNGLIQRMVGIMPEKAMKMQAWFAVSRYLDDKYDHQLKYSKWLLGGAVAGAATTVVGCPSERAMVLAQIRKQGFVQVIRTTGLQGLYKGWTATLYRDILFNTVFFTSREIFVEQYTQRIEEPNAGMRVILGLPAGCLASIVGCPHDVIKTRMQGKELGATYHSCSKIFFDIIRQEGPRNLMKGLVPRLVAVPSMMSWFYVINEELMKFVNCRRSNN